MLPRGWMRIVWCAIVISAACDHLKAQGPWQEIDDGLWFGTFAAPTQSIADDAEVTVIRADLGKFALRLVCAGALDSVNRTVRQWCVDQRLVAAINAGMYATDYSTHVGLCIDGQYVNNQRVRRDYKTVLAFNPVSQAHASAALIDFTCDDFARERGKYRTLVQNLRMISCRRENVWSPQDKRYSIAAFALDSAGRALFIFCAAPFSVHDFNDMLLRLPLALSGAMYLEGGAPAGLYLSYNGREIARYGRPEAASRLDGKQTPLAIAYPLPNVLGLVKR
jgi:hypothetical protein